MLTLPYKRVPSFGFAIKKSFQPCLMNNPDESISNFKNVCFLSLLPGDDEFGDAEGFGDDDEDDGEGGWDVGDDDLELPADLVGRVNDL